MDSLVVVRVAFGLLMTVLAIKLLATGGVERLYLAQSLHVKYPLFGWVPDPTNLGMRLMLGLVAGSGLLVALGFLYRVAASVLFGCWGCVFFCDLTPYQNHDYLAVLLSFLFVLMPLNRALSLDARIRPAIACSTVPAWCLYVFRFQIAIVYLFGGIRKLNPDWLRGEPIRSMLHAEAFSHPLVGHRFFSESIVAAFAYGGLMLDLLIVPALLWRRTRLPAFVVSLVFHVTNAWLWDIDIFPWFMLAATLSFFPPDYPQRVVAWFRGRPAERRAVSPVARGERLSRDETLLVVLLALYAGVQLLLPCRPFLHPGHPLEQNQLLKFSWNMMLRLDDVRLLFVVVDRDSGESREVDPQTILSPFQLGRMGEPELVHQAAKYLARREREHGHENVAVHVRALQRVHARKWQVAYDPDVDLAALPQSLGVKAWVLPFEERYPPDPKVRTDFERARWEFCKEQGWLPLSRHAGDSDVRRQLQEWAQQYRKSLGADPANSG